MELQFTGRGAAFLPQEGSTSAYFIEKKNLFLIDCGESTYLKLLSRKLLRPDFQYFLMVTHTHSDHIGSLGSLVMDLYWRNKVKLSILTAPEMKYINPLVQALTIFECPPEQYQLCPVHTLDNHFQTFDTIRFQESNHSYLASCGIVFSSKQHGDTLYTGDVCDTKLVETFLAEHDSIDKIYVDTSYTPSGVHVSYDTLKEVIPTELRKNVYCMHINDKKLIKQTKKDGFQLAKTKRPLKQYFKEKNL